MNSECKRGPRIVPCGSPQCRYVSVDFVSDASNEIIIDFVTLYKQILLFTVTVDFPPAELSITLEDFFF